MDILHFLFLNIAGVLLLVVTLLFGQNPLFARTPLPWLHWLLTEGLCDGAAAAAARLGGRRATNALEALAQLCCERSNPVVQLLFLTLVMVSFTVFARTVFPMLPLPGVPAWHKYTGTAVAVACLALFLGASFADPGTVTAANAAAHAALYPHAGVLYPRAKKCGTCRVQRPARSKHCRVCGRCVARLDHHCIWVNNCVGLLNMRLFLAFLTTTAFLCLYGTVLGYLTLMSDMAHHDTWHLAFHDPATDKIVYLTDSWRLALRYITAAYGPQAAVTFFAGAASLIVLGFLAFQLYLVATGTTTIELHKGGDALLAWEMEAEAAELMERVDRALANGQQADRGKAGAGLPAAAATSGGAGAGLPGGEQQHEEEPQRRRARGRVPKPYHRGVWRNFSEVLFPGHHLQMAAAAVAAAVVPLGGGGEASSGGGGKKRC